MKFSKFGFIVLGMRRAVDNNGKRKKVEVATARDPRRNNGTKERGWTVDRCRVRIGGSMGRVCTKEGCDWPRQRGEVLGCREAS